MSRIFLRGVVLFLIIVSSFILLQERSKESHIVKEHIDKSTHLRFAHNTPKESALHQAAVRFAEEVKRKTEGEIIIDIYPAQELGNDYQMVEMARKGEIDILLTPTAKMSVSVPSMQYADLPFYFPSRQDLYDMLDGEPGDIILSDMQKIGLVGVTFWENGFKSITANRPILTPHDLKDMRVRVMKSRIIKEQFQSFGAIPLAIDFHKTKEALRDKIVDAEENPLIAIVSMEFYKEQSDLTLSEHAFLGYVLSFSNKSLSKLSSSTRSILIETAKEVTPWEREETQKREAELLEIIENSGVKIHRLTESQRQLFRQKVAHIAEMYEYTIGVDVISKTKELLYKKYGASSQNREHLLIGINADASIGSELAGMEIKRGVELAVEEINREGGLLGKPLEVILKNHKIMPSVGVQNIKEFAEYPNLIAIVGGKHSAVVAEEREVVDKLKIPYLIPWAAAAKVTQSSSKDNYIFRISANDAIASKFIVDYLLKHHKNPAIIVENSLWGRGNLKEMQKYLKKRAKRFNLELVFNRGSENFYDEIERLKNSDADSLLLIANAREGSKIVNELCEQNSTLPIVSHWGVLGGEFFQENKKELLEVDFTLFETFSFKYKETEQSQKLLKAYKLRYKSDGVRIEHAVAQAYDIVMLLAEAVKQADSVEPQKVKEALENLSPHDGVMKRYAPAFTQQRHDALNRDDYYMAKFTSSGTMLKVE